MQKSKNPVRTTMYRDKAFKMRKKILETTETTETEKAKAETNKKTEETYNSEDLIKELKEKYNCNIREKYDAFISEEDTFLFICIVKAKLKHALTSAEKHTTINIFFFGNQNPHIHTLEKEDVKQLGNRWKVLKEELKNQNVGEIRKCGSFFYEKLLGNQLILPSNLSNERNGMGGIWIFCAVADIDPIWEWLCTKNSKGEDFFWGDEFHIVRIPENCDFNVSDFEVEKFALLTDNSCSPAFILSNTIHNCLENILSCSNITISEILNSYDYIHIGAYKETFENHDYNKKIKQILSRTKELDEKLNLKFLFLNTFCRATSSTHASPAKLISALSPLAWVDCSLNIPEELASNFITNFYEEIETSLRNNKEANVVEIFLKTRKKMIIQGGFGLFGYIIKGNPHCKLKLAKVSCPSTASIVQ